VLEIDIAPRSEPPLCVAKAWHEIELEADLFRGRAGLEKLGKLEIFVDRGRTVSTKLGQSAALRSFGLPCCFITCERTTSEVLVSHVPRLTRAQRAVPHLDPFTGSRPNPNEYPL
jgi:hypothetical protein